MLKDELIVPSSSSILADALSSITSTDQEFKSSAAPSPSSCPVPWWKDGAKLAVIMACAGGDEIGLKALNEAEGRAAKQRALILASEMDAETQSAARLKLNKAVLTFADVTATVESVERDAYEKACERKWGTVIPTPPSSAFAALGNLHISPRIPVVIER